MRGITGLINSGNPYLKSVRLNCHILLLHTFLELLHLRKSSILIGRAHTICVALAAALLLALPTLATAQIEGNILDAVYSEGTPGDRDSFLPMCLLAQSTLATHSESDFDDQLIRNAVGNLLRLVEGPFGALVMVVAGLIAIAAAAMGAYRQALSILIVALCAFTLRSLVSLFFGVDYPAYESF